MLNHDIELSFRRSERSKEDNPTQSQSKNTSTNWSPLQINLVLKLHIERLPKTGQIDRMPRLILSLLFNVYSLFVCHDFLTV